MRVRWSYFLGGLVCLALAVFVYAVSGDRALVEVASFSHEGRLTCLAFSPDGRHLVAGSQQLNQKPDGYWAGQLTVWRLDDGRQVETVRFPTWVRSVAFSPDGDALAVGCGAETDGAPDFLKFKQQPGSVIVYEFPSLQQKAMANQGTAVTAVRFADKNTLLAASSGSPVFGVVRVYPADTLADSYLFGGTESRSPTISVSRTAGLVAIGDSRSGTAGGGQFGPPAVKLVDLKTGVRRRELPMSSGGGPYDVTSAELAPVGASMAVLVERTHFMLWDVADGRDVTPEALRAALRGRGWRILSPASFSPDGKLLAMTANQGGRTGRGDAGVFIWDLAAQRVWKQWWWPEPRMMLPCVTFSPDGRLLAVGNDRGGVWLFAVPE